MARSLLWKRIQRIVLTSPPFTKYLLVTNLLTGAAIDFTGDQITQRKLEKKESGSVDWDRTGRMVSMSLLLGGPAHYWYLYLEKLYPLITKRQIAKKILVDILIGGPFFISAFYVTMSQLEGATWKESVAELKRKFLPTFMVDLILWPLVQVVNFYYLPISLRLIYINTACLAWSITLSFLKHNEIDFSDLSSWRK